MLCAAVEARRQRVDSSKMLLSILYRLEMSISNSHSEISWMRGWTNDRLLEVEAPAFLPQGCLIMLQQSVRGRSD